MATQGDAPGHPGISPTWTSSAKDLVSTALGPSRIWATFGHGIVNEVYWPTTGHPQIRDLGFIVEGPNGWTEVKRVANYKIATPRGYVPLPTIVHRGDDYRLELEFLPHPRRDVLLIRYRLEGDDLKLYVLLAPHLGGDRRNNTARAGAELIASQAAAAVCLHADDGFARTSAGYVGVSDGWQDFTRNGTMTWNYAAAAEGNLALTGELAATTGTLALGFASSPQGARTLARSALADDYRQVRADFISAWEQWGETLAIPRVAAPVKREAELSAAVIKVHEDKAYSGAIVASLSVPWGSAHDDPGGYHLVWTRDMVESAMAMMTVGQTDDAVHTLAYLIGTQGDDGSWPQNFYPDGRGYWTGKQLDEVALPVLLAARLRAAGRVRGSVATEDMVRKAVAYLVMNGPMSDQDRWEENAGASPFTLAVTIAALVAVARDFPKAERAYILSVADCWNERIENWTYSPGGPLGEGLGVDGYYVRLGPRFSEGGMRGTIDVRNVTSGEVLASDLVGMEFLYLVRTGLRAANDKRVTDTLKVVDAHLRAETPSGAAYHRYNGDGYGEHEDGAPFDGTGIGRLWPLLAGERGHFAVMAGEDPIPYLQTMMRMAGPGGMIPEQVWDADPIPERGLYPGRPSGSAMPLVWAHGEFLKLLAAGANGRPAELLDAVTTRYDGKRPKAKTWHWRKNSIFTALPDKCALKIEAPEPFTLRVGFDDWQSPSDHAASEGPFGSYAVTFKPAGLQGAKSLVFTFHYTDPDRWEGADFAIALGGGHT